MITKNDVDQAHEAAVRALRDRAEIRWIRESAWFERAYHLGLCLGLRAIANEDDIQPVEVLSLARTMKARRADDSFNATAIGKEMEALKHRLWQESSDLSGVAEAIQTLIKLVDKHDSEWQSRIKHVRGLLRELNELNQPVGDDTRAAESSTQRERRVGGSRYLVESLEQSARYVALIETNHSWWETVVTSVTNQA